MKRMEFKHLPNGFARHRCAVLLTSLLLVKTTACGVESAEVVVYGGTSGGVIAAVQAARMGGAVILIEPSHHLGGMSSGGLGATDVGRSEAIGGMAREFYRRVKNHYLEPSAWRYGSFDEYRTHRHDPNLDAMWYFEPHVAEKIFWEFIRETGVQVFLGERLELGDGVKKSGTRITTIVMESGREFSGRMFIDASYEGDLMAKAGVAYTIGRESGSVYGESGNGNQWQVMRSGPRPLGPDFFRAVDPYVKPGDPASGTIFGVPASGPGEMGVGDACVQAYCFRLCLTDVPENQAPFSKPADYDPARYELVLRHLLSDTPLPEWPQPPEVEHPVLGRTLTTTPPRRIMPNRKSDSNTKGAISFDFVGGNYDYPDGDYATRERILRAHESWQQGLIWFVANDPRVPAKYREPMEKWGLAKDEFTDNGHWPHQLYVREGRRMIGEFVMTQHTCEGRLQVEDSVGLGSYTMDSHIVRRYVDEYGYVRNEGKIRRGVKQPYGISFRSIVPKRADCENLLVPVCMSASHVAYSSIRMEPVYMILCQSAAAAAVQAISADVPIQHVDYTALRQRLLADAQILDWPGDESLIADPPDEP